ncbi:cyclic nucleotide-gated cation channel beta-1-like [Acipenser ruthenus]|uniref:cyclic nucleotide-gated cation channel beta-1-like n=1 Tax=Acipenser ruthenus TaxID=7906 RepID=UPI002741D985|nr:cyclic nucleotide-gated cation channel beta-1-like [Acipenser ruthenus]
MDNGADSRRLSNSVSADNRGIGVAPCIHASTVTSSYNINIYQGAAAEKRKEMDHEEEPEKKKPKLLSEPEPEDAVDSGPALTEYSLSKMEEYADRNRESLIGLLDNEDGLQEKKEKLKSMKLKKCLDWNCGKARKINKDFGRFVSQSKFPWSEVESFLFEKVGKAAERGRVEVDETGGDGWDSSGYFSSMNTEDSRSSSTLTQPAPAPPLEEDLRKNHLPEEREDRELSQGLQTGPAPRARMMMIPKEGIYDSDSAAGGELSAQTQLKEESTEIPVGQLAPSAERMERINSREQTQDPALQLNHEAGQQQPAEPSLQLNHEVGQQQPAEPSLQLNHEAGQQQPAEPSLQLNHEAGQQQPAEPSLQLNHEAGQQQPAEPSLQLNHEAGQQQPADPSLQLNHEARQQQPAEPSLQLNHEAGQQQPAEPSLQLNHEAGQQQPAEPSLQLNHEAGQQQPTGTLPYSSNWAGIPATGESEEGNQQSEKGAKKQTRAKARARKDKAAEEECWNKAFKKWLEHTAQSLAKKEGKTVDEVKKQIESDSEVTFIDNCQHADFTCLTARECIVFEHEGERIMVHIDKRDKCLTLKGKGIKEGFMFQLQYTMWILGDIKGTHVVLSDAGEILEYNFDEASLEQFHVNFPRIINKVFLPAIALYKQAQRERAFH